MVHVASIFRSFTDRDNYFDHQMRDILYKWKNYNVMTNDAACQWNINIKKAIHVLVIQTSSL